MGKWLLSYLVSLWKSCTGLGGGALGLNLVLVQKLRARAAASRGATVGRQDIPVQDEETSVTTCYANPRAREGKKRGGGAWTVKTVSAGTVCLRVRWQEG